MLMVRPSYLRPRGIAMWGYRCVQRMSTPVDRNYKPTINKHALVIRSFLSLPISRRCLLPHLMKPFRRTMICRVRNPNSSTSQRHIAGTASQIFVKLISRPAVISFVLTSIMLASITQSACFSSRMKMRTATLA